MNTEAMRRELRRALDGTLEVTLIDRLGGGTRGTVFGFDGIAVRMLTPFEAIPSPPIPIASLQAVVAHGPASSGERRHLAMLRSTR